MVNLFLNCNVFLFFWSQNVSDSLIRTLERSSVIGEYFMVQVMVASQCFVSWWELVAQATRWTRRKSNRVPKLTH